MMGFADFLLALGRSPYFDHVRANTMRRFQIEYPEALLVTLGNYTCQ
jgi:hypothetical protein